MLRLHHAVAATPIEPNWALVVGSVLWTVTYVLIIRKALKDQAYGIPMFAVCLNITWELYFSLDCPMIPACTGADCLCPERGLGGKAIVWSWLALDLVLLYQLLRYGRKLQILAPARRHFVPLVASILVFAFFWHYTFITFFDDIGGAVDAWLIDMVMSFLFIELLFARSSLLGLSYAAAWAKLGGNAFTAIGFLIIHPLPFPGHQNVSLIYYLLGVTVGLDVLYVYLFRHRRHELAESAPGAL